MDIGPIGVTRIECLYKNILPPTGVDLSAKYYGVTCAKRSHHAPACFTSVQLLYGADGSMLEPPAPHSIIPLFVKYLL